MCESECQTLPILTCGWDISHLQPLREAVQAKGSRTFSSILDNIAHEEFALECYRALHDIRCPIEEQLAWRNALESIIRDVTCVAGAWRSIIHKLEMSSLTIPSDTSSSSAESLLLLCNHACTQIQHVALVLYEEAEHFLCSAQQIPPFSYHEIVELSMELCVS